MTAETGCGKTLIYLVSMIQSIMELKKLIAMDYNTPLGVILVPTRELAIQVGVIIIFNFT